MSKWDRHNQSHTWDSEKKNSKCYQMFMKVFIFSGYVQYSSKGHFHGECLSNESFMNYSWAAIAFFYHTYTKKKNIRTHTVSVPFFPLFWGIYIQDFALFVLLLRGLPAWLLPQKTTKFLSDDAWGMRRQNGMRMSSWCCLKVSLYGRILWLPLKVVKSIGLWCFFGLK